MADKYELYGNCFSSYTQRLELREKEISRMKKEYCDPIEENPALYFSLQDELKEINLALKSERCKV